MKPFRLVLLLSCVIVLASPASMLADTAVAPVVGSQAEPTVTPAPVPTPTPVVPVAEPAAPPEWAQEIMVAAEALPLVGPLVAKLILYAGIISSILTTIVACVLGVLNTLLGVFNIAGLVRAAAVVAAFRDSKFMYWLKFFSVFNAKKKPAA